VYDGVTVGQLEGAPEYTFARINQVAVARNGSIYVMDSPFRGTHWLRVYDANGKHVRNIGRPGSGPGEYVELDGIGFLPDQRLLVLDGRLKRISVFAPGGAFITTWQAPTVIRNSSPPSLIIGPTGKIAVLHQPPDNTLPVLEVIDTRVVMVLNKDGSLLESRKPPPTRGLKVVSKRESPRAVSAMPIPYAPEGQWLWSPLGHFAVAPQTDRYSIDLLPVGKPALRITRSVITVPIPKGERDELMTVTQQRLDSWPGQQTQPLAIPEVKPAVKSMMFDADGRLLVSVATPSERYEPSEERSRDGKVIPQVRWRSPEHYDVFEPDGKYVGQFAVPHAVRRLTFVRGDQVWAIVRDEFDVDYLKKYRIVWQ
jgi:hypothetical protein